MAHTPQNSRRVLVTGFLDWPQPGEDIAGFNRWRCRDNPSGRLLLGSCHEGLTPPVPGDGPLYRALVRDAPDIDWHFEVLPVQWGAVESLPLESFDTVIGLGLGVYDHDFRLLIERGASNRRAAGADVDGVCPGLPGGPSGAIDPGAPEVLAATPEQEQRIDAAVAACAGAGPWQLRIADARADNTYLCNETHYLVSTRLAARRPPGCGFFIHLPVVRDPVRLEAIAGFLVRPMVRLARG